MPSPKLLRRRSSKRPFRVAILGQNGVGKSALTVRFLTRRFIGDYDPLLEKVYSCCKFVGGENVAIDLLDTAVQNENNRLLENIRWADAYILMYSVTDRCSFNECSRMKFLINAYRKRQRKIPDNESVASAFPVIMVGNQIDRDHDRMVTEQEGRKRANQLGCVAFYEISVRENADCVEKLFQDMYPLCKRSKKYWPVAEQSQTVYFAAGTQTKLETTEELERRKNMLYTTN
ncbi:hypothetical protein ScPMuIL_013396 [Solemya velum]